jgi:hypothetical protein
MLKRQRKLNKQGGEKCVGKHSISHKIILALSSGVMRAVQVNNLGSQEKSVHNYKILKLQEF